MPECRSKLEDICISLGISNGRQNIHITLLHFIIWISLWIIFNLQFYIFYPLFMNIGIRFVQNEFEQLIVDIFSINSIVTKKYVPVNTGCQSYGCKFSKSKDMYICTKLRFNWLQASPSRKYKKNEWSMSSRTYFLKACH